MGGCHSALIRGCAVAYRELDRYSGLVELQSSLLPLSEAQGLEKIEDGTPMNEDEQERCGL